LITLKGDIVTVIDDVGESIILSLSKLFYKVDKKQMYNDKNFDTNNRNPYVRFREHINYISDFYERYFHYEDWVKKQQLIEGLYNLRIAN
jgi:hypothetical protein